VAITVGIPILSAVAATQSLELTGIRLALTVNVAVTLVSVVLIWIGLRPRTEIVRNDRANNDGTFPTKSSAAGRPRVRA
jgi:hypothetical protein